MVIKQSRQKPILLHASDGVTCLLPPDSMGSVCRTHTYVRVTAGDTVSWKAKCSKEVSKLCDAMGWDKENPVGFPAAHNANVFQNANTYHWNIDFPYHTHLSFMSACCSICFATSLSFLNGRMMVGWRKKDEIFGVNNKKKIQSPSCCFSFLLYRPRQKDAMKAWCSD